MRVNWRRAALIYLIGFVVARAYFYQMNPLVMGFFTAAYLNRAGGVFLLIAILTGLVTVMPPEEVMTYFLAMVVSLVVMEVPLIKKREMPQSVRYAIPAVVLAVFSLIEAAATGWKPEYVALAVLEAMITYVSGVILRSGVHFLLHETKGYRPDNEKMFSLALLMAAVIYGMPVFDNGYIAPLETIIYFGILFSTYQYGIGQGTVTGAVSGFALSLRGAGATHIGVFTMLGIIPSLFRGMGRIPVAAVFAVTASVMGLADKEMALSANEISALSSAILLFLLLPKSIIYRVDSDLGSSDFMAARNLKKIADARMKIFSDSFLKLSKTLDAITEKQTVQKQESSYIFEDISEKLCKNCRNCGACWEGNFQETYQAASDIFDTAEKNGYIKKEDIPVYFLDNCINADQFIEETNRGFEIAKLNHIWSSRMVESRKVIADQLKEVSFSIQEVTNDIYGSVHTIRKEEQVLRKLKSGHIKAKNLAVIEREDKRLEIFMDAATTGGRCVTAREAAALIGEALDTKIKVSESSKTVLSKEYDNYVFAEDTKFKVLTGVARAVKENVSGDNFSILKLETGNVMLALSDGMGTGSEAGEESETVLSLLEQMIEAGFKTETAIRLINSSLVLKAEKQTFSTVDLSIIDLYTGMCEFVKIGAASAFIKRDNWVETISSTTLPVGMFGSVDYDSVTKKLYEGDIVILVTDGVLDCIREENKEACMEQLIISIHSSNPQEIANRILDNALMQSNYVPIDDMTVITAGIWLK